MKFRPIVVFEILLGFFLIFPLCFEDNLVVWSFNPMKFLFSWRNFNLVDFLRVVSSWFGFFELRAQCPTGGYLYSWQRGNPYNLENTGTLSNFLRPLLMQFSALPEIGQWHLVRGCSLFFSELRGSFWGSLGVQILLYLPFILAFSEVLSRCCALGKVSFHTQRDRLRELH